MFLIFYSRTAILRIGPKSLYRFWCCHSFCDCVLIYHTSWWLRTHRVVLNIIFIRYVSIYLACCFMKMFFTFINRTSLTRYITISCVISYLSQKFDKYTCYHLFENKRIKKLGYIFFLVAFYCITLCFINIWVITGLTASSFA